MKIVIQSVFNAYIKFKKLFYLFFTWIIFVILGFSQVKNFVFADKSKNLPINGK